LQLAGSYEVFAQYAGPVDGVQVVSPEPQVAAQTPLEQTWPAAQA